MVIHQEVIRSLSGLTDSECHIQKVMELGFLNISKELFSKPKTSPMLVYNVLKAIHQILAFAKSFFEKGENTYISEVEELGILAQIEKLQEHESTKVYEISLKIIEDFYSFGEENFN